MVGHTSFSLGYFLESPQAQRHTWLLHVDGVSTATSSAHWTATPLPEGVPWKYLQVMQQAAGSAPYWVVFEHEGRQFRVDLVSDGPVVISRCGFPVNDARGATALPLLLISAVRPQGWFAAVYRTAAGPDHAAGISLQDDVLQSCLTTLTVSWRTFSQRVPKVVPHSTSG